MADNDKKRRHFLLQGATHTEPFRRPAQVMQSKPIPEQDRQSHGARLLAEVDALKPEMETAKKLQANAGLDGGFGLAVEFESFPDIELAFESLARNNRGIELLNVRQDDHLTRAAVFVPDGKLGHFESLILDYLAERKDKTGKPLDNKKLLNTIASIRTASLRELWTDDLEALPADDEELFWCEVWLPVRKDRQAVVDSFRRLARAQGLEVTPGELAFPERTVVMAHTSVRNLTRSIMVLNSVAELRRAKETAEFFDAELPEDQPGWADELLGRTRFVGGEEANAHVCLIDTGVNRGNPLITAALAAADQHSVEPSWGVDDANGHGTAMAGLALFGNLTDALDSSETLTIEHRLESVKLLEDDGANGGDARHHGYLTVETVARPEVTAPFRRRVYSMPVTARDNRDRGRPSAWSAALDSLAADIESDGLTSRLFAVSAGNINDPNAWADYPHSNASDGVHDPAQAWNVLTVGAFTNLVHITEPNANGYKAIADRGGLSPFSTTSVTWQSNWPLKPDVVFEGGNAALDALGAVWTPSSSLLTAHHQPTERLFTTTNATSAATALAARMVAQLMAAYPQLRIETVRGLVVHSARWTENMEEMFLPPNGRATKRDYANLIRHCGFGVPDLERACWSVSNSLTMIDEASLHPFECRQGGQPKLRDMNLHRLPWPLAELEALGNTPVEMRVTLSYFIEPNPSERGFRSRYRYESHGLRFEVKRPTESAQDFGSGSTPSRETRRRARGAPPRIRAG